MTQEQANQLAHEWILAWNSHDLDRITRHYHPEIEFSSPFVNRLIGDAQGKIRGIEALRQYFAKALESYPTLHFELKNVYAGVSSMVLEYYSVNNLHAAETMEVDSNGLVRRVSAHYTQRINP